jgi:hypothetical protein
VRWAATANDALRTNKNVAIDESTDIRVWRGAEGRRSLLPRSAIGNAGFLLRKNRCDRYSPDFELFDASDAEAGVDQPALRINRPGVDDVRKLAVAILLPAHRRRDALDLVSREGEMHQCLPCHLDRRFELR